MSRGQTVLLACRISPSSFSGERVFRIALANNTEYIGVCAGRLLPPAGSVRHRLERTP